MVSLDCPSRGSEVLHLCSYDTGSEEWEWLPSHPWLDNVSGWCSPQYYETIRLFAIGDAVNVVARGAKFLHVATYDTLTCLWAHLLLPPEGDASEDVATRFSDASGWDQRSWFDSFRVAVTQAETGSDTATVHVIGRCARAVLCTGHCVVVFCIMCQWMLSALLSGTNDFNTSTAVTNA